MNSVVHIRGTRAPAPAVPTIAWLGQHLHAVRRCSIDTDSYSRPAVVAPQGRAVLL